MVALSNTAMAGCEPDTNGWVTIRYYRHIPEGSAVTNNYGFTFSGDVPMALQIIGVDSVTNIGDKCVVIWHAEYLIDKKQMKTMVIGCPNNDKGVLLAGKAYGVAGEDFTQLCFRDAVGEL